MPIDRTALDLLSELRKTHEHAGDFCFFTDEANLPSIVTGKRLYCRREALDRGLIEVDGAAPEVLSKAPGWAQNYVRLYFAPKTPMLYQTEGLKRVPDEWPHCPRPVYLVFKPDILLLRGARVSDGNISSGYSTCPDRPSSDYFCSLPFPDIYSRGTLPSQGASRLQTNRRRQAEVLIETDLSLDFVDRIIFRSDAERVLAFRDLPTLAHQFDIEVDSNWFYAPTTGRPYLNTFTNSELDVANLAVGDKLVQVSTSAAGAVESFRCIYGEGGWSEWEPARVTRKMSPNPGWTRYFLNGWRVAEKAQ